MKTLSDGRVQHDAVVGQCPKSECGGDLVAVTGWGAWTDEMCLRCNCSWCFQVPREIRCIAPAEAAEKKRRASAPDLAGQIATLKDHLRIADARLSAAEDILRRIVDACDSHEDGQIDGAVIEEARAHLDMPAVQSPITDAAIDAAKPWTTASWNTCLKCKNPVEKAGGDVDFADGDEARCVECKTVFMVSIAGGGASLYEPEEEDAPDSEAAAVTEADPLAGLPEDVRVRIVATAEKAQADSVNPWQFPRNGHPPTCPYRRDALNVCTCSEVYHATLAREAAAYRAQHAPEALTREEAEKRLRAIEPPFSDVEIADILDSPRETIAEASPEKDIPPQARETSRAVLGILRAYVCGLDAQKSAVAT